MKIVVITDVFLKTDSELFNRGSVIILWHIIEGCIKKYNVDFEIYQLGNCDLVVNYKAVKVNVIKSSSIKEYIKKLNKINFECDILHFNNIDCYFENEFINTGIVHTNAYIETNKNKEDFKNKLKEFNSIVVVNKDYNRVFNNKNIKFIPNGIDLKLFNYNKIKFNKKIFFPNNPTPKKNVAFAFELMNKLGSDYKLYVADDKNKYNLKNKNIKFIGRGVSQRKMIRYYKKCFYVIIPSLSESCSLCALEAMAMKNRLIANDISGLKNYVEHKLIDCNNIDLWVKEIKKGFNEDIEKEIIDNCGITKKYYGIDEMVNNYYDMWKEVLNNYGNKRN